MKVKASFVLSLIFIIIILRIITFSENFIENFYSRSAYKIISGNINKLSSSFNFSAAEILLLLFLIAIIIFLIIAVKHYFFNTNLKSLKDKINSALNFVYIIICFIAIVYIIFLMVWGLNYYRTPLIKNYPNKNISDDDIHLLADILIKNLNNIKDEMKYKKINTNYQALNRMIESEYHKIFEEFDFLNMQYSKTKPIKISKIFLNLQITGIYSPFTSEANVNILIPSVSLPFTIAHEMAHQIGIAYEDEANFISYIACSKHSDPFIRYSGNFEVLLYVLNEMKRDENYYHIMSNLNSETKEEIKEYYNFWDKYIGNLSNVSQKINDAYLKANRQSDGIKSYSRVVKLLVLYHYNINY